MVCDAVVRRGLRGYGAIGPHRCRCRRIGGVDAWGYRHRRRHGPIRRVRGVGLKHAFRNDSMSQRSNNYNFVSV